MTTLETWLAQATCGLSKDSMARVRSEIQEHYESAKEHSLGNGATLLEADRSAIAALGDPRVANHDYRRVLLTSAEARVLREAKCETTMFMRRSWIKWTFLALPVALWLGALFFFLRADGGSARMLLGGGLATSVFVCAPFLPLYTLERGRLFRPIKWIAFTGILYLGFGFDSFKMLWLIAPCMTPFIMSEIKRISIRRKLRVADWPKSLYL